MNWWHEASPDARRALVAASLGWMLDAFDVMLYAMVLATLMPDLGLDKATAGSLGSLTLVASAAGGLIFGVVADRYGRTRALMASVVIYSVFTAACGLAQTVAQLAMFRIGLGLGMGGEWASGAALVSETWPARNRGKALAMMQSSWAVGYGLAAAVTMIVMPRFGWRAVFFVGVLPALFVFWIRRHVREPDVWTRTARAGVPRGQFLRIFRRPLLGLTLAVTAMNACTMFAWWGFNLWIPSYLALPVAEGGIGLTTTTMGWFVVVMQVGMFLGYVTFGFISDEIGRRRTYVAYLLMAAVLILVYASTSSPAALLALGPLVAFFGTGYFSGFGAVTAEIYDTGIRATAQGFTYNMGRVVSAIAPFAVGSLFASHGFPAALRLVAAAFAAAAVIWVFIPETRGRELS